jgi:hypothetical protein
MSDVIGGMIEWLAAEAERPGGADGRTDEGVPRPRQSQTDSFEPKFSTRELNVTNLDVTNLPAHQFPGKSPLLSTPGRSGVPAENAPIELAQALEGELPAGAEQAEEVRDDDRERRIYRNRTVAMLRRYMKYSIETGRLPSLLGKEFFRAKVTSYSVGTFEDRVIFVHDMEICLDRLDEFSRQIIARHFLQEYDQAETGRLLQCTERTVRTYIPIVLDMLSEILIEVGLMDRLESDSPKSCQGGIEDQKFVSDCEQGKNKF